MKTLLQIFIFVGNVLFLLINGMKGVFASNPSGLTYFGLLLATVSMLYFLPAIARIVWTYATRQPIAGDDHEHVSGKHV